MTVVVSLPFDMTVCFVSTRLSRRALCEGAEREASSTASSLDEESLVVSSSDVLDEGVSSSDALNGGVSSLRGLNGGPP